jgi:hypothetical protein
MDYLEDISDISVQRFENVKKDGLLHNGIVFSATAFFGDLKEIPGVESMYYKATLIGPNRVFFELPATNYYLRNESKMVSYVERSEKIKEARAITRNLWDAEPHRLVRRIMLVFPGNYNLSNKHYSKHSDAGFGLITRSEYPIATSFKLGTENVVTNNVHVVWKVTALDEKERRLAKKEVPTKETIDSLAAYYKQLKIDTAANMVVDDKYSDDDSE